MRIIVSDVAAQMGGAIVILKGLYNYIKENDHENEWIFLLSQPFVKETGNIKVILYENVKKSPLNRVFYDLFEGKKLEKMYHPDFFFSLQNNLFKGVKTPQAVYMQQSLPFQDIKNFSPFKKGEFKSFYYQHIVGSSIKKSLPKASKIVVQTKWIRDAVIEKCGVDKERMIVVNPEVTPVKRDKSITFDNRSFFSPITEVTYKNMDCIVKACEMLKDANFSVDVTFDGKSPYDRINYLGYIDREKLDIHYQSSVVIYPSYIETFGIPMAEAASAGTIVLASDCPFSHEILDGYENAYFFDPFKPAELADLMRKVIAGEIVKKDCTAPGENVASGGEAADHSTLGTAENGSTTAGNSWAAILEFILGRK